MKKILIAGIAAAALSGAPALAADYPAKAVPAPAAFNWTGFYVGGEAGYGFGHTSHFISGTTFSTNEFEITGLVGGGTAGYNWQFGPNWLVGIETDFSLSGIEGNGGSLVTAFGCVISGGCHTSLDWFGTVRGRAGFIYGNALFYGTGGWAYGKAEADLQGCSTGPTAGFCGRKNVSGWTAGGGIEYALDRNWSAKLEYLYVNMGNFVYAPNTVVGCGPTGCSSSAKFDLVRIGLNYKFGSQ